MSNPRVYIDWNKDGDFSDVGEEVTAYVLAGPGVTVQYGRDQVTALAPTVSGSGSLTLDNASRRFSPLNTAGPLYGSLKPARPVLIERDLGGSTTTQFRGHTDDEPLSPDPASPTVTLTLVDSLADFRGQTVTTPLYRDIRTGQAIGYILDACGWPTADRDLDAGATIIPWFWLDGADAMTALEDVVRSEGPPAMLTMSESGDVVFKDRHHRLTDTASLTSQQTWWGTGGGLVMNLPFAYDPSWKNIVNAGTVSVEVRTPQAVQQVWASELMITLSSGEVKLVSVSASDPFYGAVAPVSGTDYTAVSGSVTATLLRTSGTSTTILLTAIGGAAVISNLQLRARPVTVSYTVQVSAEDSTSVTEYGRRSFPGDLPFCSAYDAEAVLSNAIAQRANPLPILSVRFLVGRDTNRAPLLARDLSDLVTITEPESGVDDDYYIELIEHTFSGEHDHAVVFGTEQAPAQVSPVLRFDTSGQGFNDGKFGSGIDDPAVMLRFDDSTSGHRFSEGVFAS